MESSESKKENIVCSQEFIKDKLKLVTDDRSIGFFRLDTGEAHDDDIDRKEEKLKLESPDMFFKYFEDAEIVEPDRVCRPKGDTTFFTTAGVQRIETIIRENGKLEKELFGITQPVIRSQFMDKVRDGTSTSFVNCAVESVDTNPDEFVVLCNNLIKLITESGVSKKELRFQIEDVPDRWGDRKFTKTVLTLYFNGIELGECVYIQDYPVTDDNKISIADIGFSVERFNWGIDNSNNFFSDFNEFYTENMDSNKTTAIIDCLRSMVLIAGEGIKPSSHDHGYRLRQLSKRFVSRKQGVEIDFIRLIHISYKYWGKWGLKPSTSETDITQVIELENERNRNALILTLLEESGGPKVNIDVNQSTKDFLKQVNISLPKSVVEIINKIINTIL